MKDPERDREWNMTASGRPFFPFDPRLQDFHAPDWAHMLAQQPRFRGATRSPYSVGQHSCLAARFMVLGYDGAGDEATLGHSPATCQAYGLLHDASEFVFGDTPRPHKRRPELAEAMAAEKRLQRMIYESVGLDPDREPPLLKIVDRRLLRTEQLHLMPPPAHGERRDDVPPYPEFQALGFSCWSFERTRQAWLEMFEQLAELDVIHHPNGGR